MAGLNKIEDYLIDLGISYEEPTPGTWIVEDENKGIPKLFVSYADPVVIIHARVMPAPEKGREQFFAELLKLNYEGLLHGSYALEGDEVILMDTLEYADLDKSEFEASLDAIGFALSEHYPLFTRYSGT
jgi:hypothetical protein